MRKIPDDSCSDKIALKYSLFQSENQCLQALSAGKLFVASPSTIVRKNLNYTAFILK